MIGTDGSILPVTNGMWTHVTYTEAPFTPQPEIKVTINGFTSEQWAVICELQESLSHIESMLSKLIEKNKEE
jgi:hypothetical protein